MTLYKEKYIVADELFCIINNGLKWDNSNYKPFFVQDINNKEPIFTIEFSGIENFKLDFQQYKELGDFGEDGLSLFTYKNENNNEYCLKMGNSNNGLYSILHINSTYNAAKLYLNPQELTKWFIDYCINNSLMIMYALSSAPKGVMLFHSSTIKYNNYGYMFLGKSGTGKSTHSKLWLNNIPDTVLLNDDNPAVKINSNNEAIVHGTPWSGKTPCYKNDSAKIGGIVKLYQAPYNKIEKLPIFQSYAAVLPTISCMKWEKSLADLLNKNIENLLKSTSVYTMGCLPNAEAAHICFEKIKK